jgi:hypothetical protein
LEPPRLETDRKSTHARLDHGGKGQKSTPSRSSEGAPPNRFTGCDYAHHVTIMPFRYLAKQGNFRCWVLLVDQQTFASTSAARTFCQKMGPLGTWIFIERSNEVQNFPATMRV